MNFCWTRDQWEGGKRSLDTASWEFSIDLRFCFCRLPAQIQQENLTLMLSYMMYFVRLKCVFNQNARECLAEKKVGCGNSLSQHGRGI